LGKIERKEFGPLDQARVDPTAEKKSQYRVGGWQGVMNIWLDETATCDSDIASGRGLAISHRAEIGICDLI